MTAMAISLLFESSSPFEDFNKLDMYTKTNTVAPTINVITRTGKSVTPAPVSAIVPCPWYNELTKTR
jgi:hypothetical protein